MDKMTTYNLAATCSFGLEAVLSAELRGMGYENLTVENGRILFSGDESDIARCNLWLRCADRLFIEMSSFEARDFEELFQGTKSVPWEDMIPENGRMHVVGKSVKSVLHSVPDCQSIVKKAVVEAMKRRYRRDEFPEDGPDFKIEVALLKDRVTLSVDTSGAGLHKRGYREEKGEAPLRENLAAAMVLLSKWGPHRIFADPLCGSGTIAIEAAMVGLNMAPGLRRSFASEQWPFIGGRVWEDQRAHAQAVIRKAPMTILASDISQSVFRKARDNAERAGVAEYIDFQRRPVEEFSSRGKYGCLITNPPYGERMGQRDEVAELYRNMGAVFRKLDSWSFFILTASESFEKYYGKKADRNRKLYNGNMKTYLYQYLGPLPPRNHETEE
jgi:putative N6-adenine-specific DNA methylase